jgi:hypothetical protein
VRHVCSVTTGAYGSRFSILLRSIVEKDFGQLCEQRAIFWDPAMLVMPFVDGVGIVYAMTANSYRLVTAYKSACDFLFLDWKNDASYLLCYAIEGRLLD